VLQTGSVNAGGRGGRGGGGPDPVGMDEASDVGDITVQLVAEQWFFFCGCQGLSF
jgi:hypothetical protein